MKNLPQITFFNDSKDEDIKKEGLRYLKSTRKDLLKYMKFGKIYEEGNEDLPPFHEYGLSFDFVEAGTFNDQREGYYRYQFSWGGPSDELRIYHDGAIEYVYLNWFCGIGFDVSDDSVFQDVVNFFEEIGSIDWESLDEDQIELPDDYEEEEENE